MAKIVLLTLTTVCFAIVVPCTFMAALYFCQFMVNLFFILAHIAMFIYENFNVSVFNGELFHDSINLFGKGLIWYIIYMVPLVFLIQKHQKH